MNIMGMVHIMLYACLAAASQSSLTRNGHTGFHAIEVLEYIWFARFGT